MSKNSGKLFGVCLNLFIILVVLVEKVKSEVTVTRIDDTDLYVYTDGEYFGMFMITPKGIIVVDAPPTFAGNNNGVSISTMISQYSNKKIKWVIYSHHHLDHIGAASQFPDDATYICHKDAAYYIENSENNVQVPYCNEIVKNNGYKLKIDSDHIILLDYHGVIHSEGNLYIYVPIAKLLMVIDFVFPKWGPYHSLGMQGTLAKYYEAYDKVLAYNFDYYIGGHVDKIGTKDDILLSKQMFEDLKTSVQAGLNNVDYNAIVASKGGFNGVNTWTIFRAYTDAVVDYCYNLMMDVNGLDWGNKLINADAYMDTHCFLVYEYLVVNY